MSLIEHLRATHALDAPADVTWTRIQEWMLSAAALGMRATAVNFSDQEIKAEVVALAREYKGITVDEPQSSVAVFRWGG